MLRQSHYVAHTGLENLRSSCFSFLSMHQNTCHRNILKNMYDLTNVMQRNLNLTLSNDQFNIISINSTLSDANTHTMEAIFQLLALNVSNLKNTFMTHSMRVGDAAQHVQGIGFDPQYCKNKLKINRAQNRGLGMSSVIMSLTSLLSKFF